MTTIKFKDRKLQKVFEKSQRAVAKYKKKCGIPKNKSLFDLDYDTTFNNAFQLYAENEGCTDWDTDPHYKIGLEEVKKWCKERGFKVVKMAKQKKTIEYRKIRKPEYWMAFDRKINKRVAHVRKGDWLISLVTGAKQRFKVIHTKKRTKWDLNYKGIFGKDRKARGKKK